MEFRGEVRVQLLFAPCGFYPVATPALSSGYRYSWGWEFSAHLGDFGCDAFQRGFVVDVCDCGVDPLRDLAHLRVAHPARGDRRRAESDFARAEGAAGIGGYRVVVECD